MLSPEFAWPLALLIGVVLALIPRARSIAEHPRLPLLAAGVGLLACLACIATTMPVGDDWTYAVAGRHGWLEAQATTWTTWSGRFTATALLSGWPQILPLHAGYPVMTLCAAGIAVSGWAALAWRLIRACEGTPTEEPAGIGERMPGRRSGAIAALSRAESDAADATEAGRIRRAGVSSQALSTAGLDQGSIGLIALAGLGLLAGLPSLPEGGSWLAGSLTYTLPSGLACWAWALLLLPAAHPGRWQRPLALLLLVIAAGGNELTAALDAGALLITAPLLWRAGDARRWWFLSAALAAVAALAISYLAPGNLPHRIAYLDGRTPPGLVDGLAHALDSGLRILSDGTADAGLALLALACAAGRMGRDAPAPPGWLAPLLGGLAIATAVGMQAPAVLATGWASPPRAANLVWMSAWSCLAASAICAGWWAAARLRQRPMSGAVLLRAVPAALASAAIILCLTGPGTVGRACADLVLLPAHRAAILQRRALLEGAAAGAQLDVPMLDPARTPRSCLAYDLTASRDDWSNRACATWHGLAGVRIVAPRRTPAR